MARTRISPESAGGGGGGDDPAGGGEERGLQTADRYVDGAAAGAGPGDDKAESDVPDLFSAAAAAAAIPNGGKRGHGDSSTEVEAKPEELQQRLEPPPAYDVSADEPASLEAAEHSSELSSSGEEEEAVYSEEAESLSAAVVAEESPSSSSAAAVGAAEEASEAPVCGPADPATPVGKLVELLGELADGGKVTVQHAVAVLDGDGKALARLVRVTVSRRR